MTNKVWVVFEQLDADVTEVAVYDTESEALDYIRSHDPPPHGCLYVQGREQ